MFMFPLYKILVGEHLVDGETHFKKYSIQFQFLTKLYQEATNLALRDDRELRLQGGQDLLNLLLRRIDELKYLLNCDGKV